MPASVRHRSDDLTDDHDVEMLVREGTLTIHQPTLPLGSAIFDSCRDPLELGLYLQYHDHADTV